MATYTRPAKVTLTATTSSTEVVASQGAGVSIDVCVITAHNSSATATSLDVYDGATQILEAIPIPAGAGFILPMPKPLRISANSALNVATNESVSSVNVNVLYDVT